MKADQFLIIEAIAKLLCSRKSMILRLFARGSKPSAILPTTPTFSRLAEQNGWKPLQRGSSYGQMSFAIASIRCFCLFFPFLAWAWEEESGLNPAASSLFQDLHTVSLIDKQVRDALPLMINYQLQGGYFTMPSARTYQEGMFGFGYSYVAPYNIWNLGFQFFNHIETTGNYWVYRKMLDGTFGHLGFGDYAERAANVKFILLRREDGFEYVPDLALGWNDFFGSCRFRSFYVTATKEFLSYNFEATLGWGHGRIDGFFGGAAWSPWRKADHFLKGLSFAAEYDANNYRKHFFEHPKGRKVNSRVNAGIQWNFRDMIYLSGSSLRGNNWAASASFHYNLGSSEGLFPKVLDRSIYTGPIDVQPLGVLRDRNELAHELAYAFKEQGFDLYSLFLIPSFGCDGQSSDKLWLKVVNVRYRQEQEVRKRIEHVLASLVPSDLLQVTAVVEAEGVAEHEYRFRLEDLQRYAAGQAGDPEMQVISPLREASSAPSPYDGALLYQRRKPIWMLTFRPWTRAFFGSATGKFKYEVGFSLGPEGYLFDQIYYCLYGSYTGLSSTQSMKAQDFLNPSRIINVRTDSLLYNQASSFHIDQAFLQKSVNWGKGLFSRFASGYFETAYVGFALENLYYPVNGDWALGFEASTLWKRKYFGLGVQHKIRKLTNEGPKYFPYLGVQYFLDFYYQYRPLQLDFKISAGQFLARDKGVRLEGARTFSSGLRVGLWYTFTNANDVVNGSRYYDKGFSITLPLDLFMNQTSRTRVGYAMSAWLRDCGARANTGKALYPTLYWERYNY